MGQRLSYRIETHYLAAPFRISGYVFEASELVVVELADDQYRGRGEAGGVYYLGDEAPRIVEQLEASRSAIEGCSSREELRHILPIGGARNAVDCAFWELEANRTGIAAHLLAGIETPRPLVTTFTLGADEPSKMAEGARRYSHARAIKTKLTGSFELDVERVRAVREARPDVWLGVDANQGFDIQALPALAQAMANLNVSLIEQPLARGREADLDGFVSPIPIAADESVLGLADVPGLAGRFQVVNIKLDKCGGLTEALLMAAEARRLGLGVMVGNMHAKLTCIPELRYSAERLGRRLIDIRKPPENIPIATGLKRSGKRLLTVGTDCALGKKYTALSIARAFAVRGIHADFRATGQTGIMISGGGIPMDAVVSDFAAGAAEMLSPPAAPDHWDVIEGQGSILHPAYAGVSLALLHGSQPDVFVVCHDPSRKRLLGDEEFPVPSVDEIIDLTTALGRRTNPAVRCGGISLNTSALDEAAAGDLCRSESARLGLPVADPIRGGAAFEQLVDECLKP